MLRCLKIKGIALLALALLPGCLAAPDASPEGIRAVIVPMEHPAEASPAMKFFAWDDFWSGGGKAFQADYQQFNHSVAVRFAPGTRPADTEDRIYWSKKPLTAANYLTDGTWSQTVTGTAATTLTIADLPPDRDIYLLAVRYNADGPVYAPMATCTEMVRTTRKLTATPPHLDIELTTTGEEFSDWFERQPTISMLTNEISGLAGGGFQVAHRPTSAALSGGVFHGKKVLAPDYDWAVEFTFSFADDNNAKPKYVTFGAASGTQALVSISARDAHSPYPTTNPNVPAGFTITDPGLYDLVPYCTQYNYLMPGSDPTTQWWPRGTGPEWQRAPGVPATIRFEYAAAEKIVRIYHDRTLIYTLSPTQGTSPDEPKRYPANHHYGFGITPQFLFEDLIDTSSAINLHNVRLESACPDYYAEWTPGYGHSGYGHYVVPAKYDGALGVNIDDPDHTLHNLAFYMPYATADKEWWWPASRFSTRLHMGYTAPYDRTAQEAAHPDAYKGLAYPYWTARTGYVAGVRTAQTPPIEVPAGTKPTHVVFRGDPAAWNAAGEAARSGWQGADRLANRE